MEYFGGRVGPAHVCYAVQPQPAGLCDALFQALPLIAPEEDVVVGQSRSRTAPLARSR